MPLTPEDVRNKRFTPVRLREGYDMGEVDQFLDEVESELERLTTDNDELRSKLEAAAGSAPAAVPDADTAVAAPAEPVAEPAPAAPAPTVAQAAGAAARLLEIAGRNADEVVAEAKEQADTILAEARTKSERLEADSRSKADRVEADARARAEKLDAETTAKRTQLFGDLERDRDALARELEHLRAFEREYRSRLRNYFTAQLAQLEGDEAAAAPLPGTDSDSTPDRLKSLLDKDPKQV